jgi:putative membrane-bound dehydrogenase-like protein
MRRIHWPAVTLLAVVLPLGAAMADEKPSTASLPRVPDGFSVELVAAAPLVEHPIMATIDDRGRLYVADNAGLNLSADELQKQLPNMIRMLEDTDGDGRYDRTTLFADKMTFPQGAAWYRGALYVASPPCIWRFEDTDDDGVADSRQELVEKFGFIGNAADIHGCFVTPTGRIAWCDGRHGHELKDADGHTRSKGLAARVFSCRPDGSDVEVFCGGGMDNPVEVAFTSEGDTIGTMTFYNPDNIRHDALVHFIYGGVYPRKHPCTSEFKRTGELMPALTRLGVTAPSGLARYVGTAWGEEFRDSLFSAQFNTHKVLRHTLARQGGTFTCADEDFLVSSDPDFHPTDVLQDADGSLLVIDTGGWFRIGCPTSQIAKPQVGGAIYRIRRDGAARHADPCGLAIDWDRTSDTQMADLLADPRPVVAERAIEMLAGRGDGAMGSLAVGLFETTDYRARQNAVWALARIGSENARLLLRQALADDDAPVRQAAAHAVSDLRDADSIFALVDMLARDEPAVRREAATALGRLGKGSAVPPLLAALRQPADRFVEHALIYALIEIGDRKATLAGLASPSASVRRGALVALDQMDGGKLTREIVAPLLATEDPALLGALVDILSRHPEWADELTASIDSWLALAEPSAEQLATARGAVAALIARPAVQKSVADALLGAGACKAARLMLLEVIAEGELENGPAIWSECVRKSLGTSDGELLHQAVVTASTLDVRPFAPRLVEIGLDDGRPSELRVAAWRAVSKARSTLPESGFAFLGSILDADESPARDRLAAAEALGAFELTTAQRARVVELFEVPNCGPLEAAWLVRAFEHDTDATVGLKLVESLAKSPALAGIPVDRLREAFKNYPSEVQSAAKKMFERSTPDERDRAGKLESLARSSAGGDAAKGEEIFFGSRAACSACHRIAGKGEKIGPDLSKIGEVRTRRDLVEAIVFPSVSLARGFESYSAVTKDGRVTSGLLGRETAAAIYLRATDRSETRVERRDIDELVPSPTSIMPQGLEKSLSPAELRDVVAYLESLK